MFRRTFSSALAIVALLSTGAAAQQDPTYESVLEAARKERTLLVAISTPGLPESQQALSAAFNKRFGIDARIEWSATSVVQSITKLIAEKGRGKASIDVIGTGGISEGVALHTQGLIKPYPWRKVFGSTLPEIGDVTEKTIPELKGSVLWAVDSVGGIAWNPKLIKDEDVPNTIAQLTDPKWKGKFSANAFGLAPIDFISIEIGVDPTRDIIKKLIENKPVLERGTAAAIRAVSIGQVPMGVALYHSAIRASTPANPLKFKLFSDYISVSHLYYFVPENSPSPNLARLFAAWAATEGAAIVRQYEPLPKIGEANSDIDNMAKKQVAESGAKIITENSLKDGQTSLEIRNYATDLISKAGQ
jgi:iron(III) transport system substrate-binding protein